MLKRPSRQNQNLLSDANVVLPGMESKSGTKPELTIAIGETALKETKSAKPESKKLFRLRRIIDPNASEQAQDQGHAWITVREPIEEPAKKRRLSTAPIESRYSDIGTDLPIETPPFDPAVDAAGTEAEVIVEGHQAARDAAQRIREQKSHIEYIPVALQPFMGNSNTIHNGR